jgi:putative FmdB family regulatory protein
VPTYEYACTECGHAFDVVQSFSDDSLTVCPECGGRLRKVFNAVGVVFKGSGFYRTDSRGKQAAESTSGSAAKGASASSETGSTTGSGSASGSSSGNGSSGSNGASSSTSGSTKTEPSKA